MNSLTYDNLASYENTYDVNTIIKPPKSNFAYSFSLLPNEERDAINTIYAFCSYIDDIVDGTPNNSQEVLNKKLVRLGWWESEIEKLYTHRLTSPILSPFSKVIDRFLIPKEYFLTLIDGVRTDLVKNRYETFDELKDYCYTVASVVGLITIEIFGYKHEETKNYAINLGYALQLTNILRDIKVDKLKNYIYLPQEDLERFNYSEQDIFDEKYNDNFINLMQFETKRNREYYHKARALLRSDERQNIISAEIMDAIYYRLLEKIELNQYNVYGKKIRVSNAHKLLITLKHWVSLNLFIKRMS
ncbi:MAG: phytoene/squalene synthase family protein [Candidatus Kapaibacteriota bacterium]|jgi:phytoene synthase